MPTATIDGVEIYYEVTGEGEPLVWSHEFAGDYRSWAPQVRFFARRYRVITYSDRGYLPSGVPDDPDAYSQGQLVDDLYGLLRHLGIARAHIGGLSMGGGVALNFALAHPEMCRGVVVAGCGTGSDDPETFRAEGRRLIAAIEQEGMAAFADTYARGPARVQFLRKDPQGWREFRDQLAEHSARGSMLTFAGVQSKRPTIYELEARLDALPVPTLIVAGDEDEPCLGPGLFMKRHIRSAGLAIFPDTGHTLNLEEPDRFNRVVLEFLTAVEQGRWPVREPRGDAKALF
ncbi:MAG TPA: alpha/beta hydrolase [Thermomicrobiales bacterium]|nr:alpha/beta hydrolase [Thermomicrobiales bacterium]